MKLRMENNMFKIKHKVLTSVAVALLITTTAVLAQNENINPLTGKVESNSGADSASAINIRIGRGDPVAGKDKSLLCQGCHGEKGISIDGLIPSLAGQYALYITKELRNYQSGDRSHQIMNAMAATISDEDLDDISAYFASLPKMQGNGETNAMGKKLFMRGDLSRLVLACVTCHGVNGKGLTPNTPMFPVIGGQKKDYLRLQLLNFKNKDRTNSPNGIMNTIAKKLTEAELDALASYISAL